LSGLQPKEKAISRIVRAVSTVLLLLVSLSTSHLPLRADESAKAAKKFDHQLVIATGEEDPRMRPFDDLMVSFVRHYQVPGAVLAVADGDRLVYARGFGFADVDLKTPVLPTSLFRIASISKPITAVAILQLVQRGQLSLDERVFDILAIEPHFEGEQHELDPRLAKITVLQLLQHTGGWDREQSFDPMFQSVRIARSLGTAPPAGADAVIRFMRGQSLDFAPGHRYAYSNFGYCLLGRIIERRSGQAYEQYVSDYLFQPLGITRPHIGHTRERSSFEVRYYGESNETGPSVFESDLNQSVPQPYGAWYLEAMDSHGGWIASAVDLVRFASAVHPKQGTGLLNEELLKTMVTRPGDLAGWDEDGEPREPFYGCGWMIRPADGDLDYNVWHTGSLPGTSTLLVTRHDHRHWAVLFNTRNSPDDERLATLIDPQLHAAADAITEWPKEDQFPNYLEEKMN
jgi:N-acyl-D-amino-acid deacylase